MKESFIFYKSWMEALMDVPDDIRLEVYDCIIEYAFSGKIPSLKPMAKMAFNFIKNDIDRASEKYVKTIERNRNNGKKGGRPKSTENQSIEETQQNPNNPVGLIETQQNPNDNDNEDDNEDDNVILLEKETKEINLSDQISEDGFSDDKIPNAEKEKSSAKKEKFKPPSVDEVQIYCDERQNDIQAYKFVNFYQSKGWKVGNQPMKDWKAAVRTWENKNKTNGQSNSNSTNAGFSNQKGNSNGSPKVPGKVSASSILARQAREQFTRNGESGDTTIEAEVVG